MAFLEWYSIAFVCYCVCWTILMMTIIIIIRGSSDSDVIIIIILNNIYYFPRLKQQEEVEEEFWLALLAKLSLCTHATDLSFKFIMRQSWAQATLFLLSVDLDFAPATSKFCWTLISLCNKPKRNWKLLRHAYGETTMPAPMATPTPF